MVCCNFDFKFNLISFFIYTTTVARKHAAHLIVSGYHSLWTLATLKALHALCRPLRNLFTPFLNYPILEPTGKTSAVSLFHNQRVLRNSSEAELYGIIWTPMCETDGQNTCPIFYSHHFHPLYYTLSTILHGVERSIKPKYANSIHLC